MKTKIQNSFFFLMLAGFAALVVAFVLSAQVLALVAGGSILVAISANTLFVNLLKS